MHKSYNTSHRLSQYIEDSMGFLLMFAIEKAKIFHEVLHSPKKHLCIMGEGWLNDTMRKMYRSEEREERAGSPRGAQISC